MVEHIKALFPRLGTTAFRVTSPRDPTYNCIAWAAGVTNNWWWPLENPAEAQSRVESQVGWPSWNSTSAWKATSPFSREGQNFDD